MVRQFYFLLFSIFLYLTSNGQEITDFDPQERKEKILQYAADRYQLPATNYSDPEKVYWPVTIARYSLYGENDSLANSYVNYPEFIHKDPFHFILVGMARLMLLHDDAPAMERHKITYLKNVYKRHDSYSPWTAEGTENHINMSRTSGYLFACEMTKFPDLFPLAERYKKMMEEWIKWYAFEIYSKGTAEFNASTYGIFNIIGWLNIYDFASDQQIKQCARSILDYYSAELALHYAQGFIGGSESRGSVHKSPFSAETEFLGWLWYGPSNYSIPLLNKKISNNKHPLQTVHAATSSYWPSREIVHLAIRNCNIPAYYLNSKPSYSLSKRSFIKQFYYIDSTFELGSALFPYGAFTTAAYKNVTWKAIFKTADINEKLPVVMSGGGLYYPDRTGSVRNPWLQDVQHKNVMILMNKMPENAGSIYNRIKDTVNLWKRRWKEDFIQRYSDKDERIVKEYLHPVRIMKKGTTSSTGNGAYISFDSDKLKQLSIFHDRVFMRINESYAVVLNMGSGNFKVEEGIISTHAKLGVLTGLALEIINAHQYNTFEEFIDAYNFSIRHIKRKNQANTFSYISLSGELIEATYRENGTFIEPLYDWGYGPVKSQVYQASPPFMQPEWPSGKGYGRIPELKINGVHIDLEKTWNVFYGVNMELSDEELIIRAKESEYSIDLSEKVPLIK
jgi:hypothetical protein